MTAFRSVIVLGMLTLLAPATETARAQQSPVTVSVTQLLELYDLGEFDVVREAVVSASHGDLSIVLGALKVDGKAWIDADGETNRDRRRLAAAVFSLEVADAALDRQWHDALQLLEWACEQMRSARRRADIERTFHLAAMALIEGAGDVKALDWHAGHLKARFPDEPRLLMVDVFQAEMEYWRLYWTVLGATDGGDPSIVLPSLKKAAGRQENAREVALRTGHLFWQKDQHEAAIAEFAKVPPGDDPGQLYLSHLLSGWSFQELKKPAEAERAFRAALGTIPRAQSATLHLGVLLYEMDRRDEANALIEEMLSADPPPSDPWRIFGYGDYRRLPMLIGELRKAIR
jgi:tetratricopeptide (TPR) repeat protein